MTPTSHHVGITVRDVEASYRFYTGLLGMHVWNQDEILDVAAPRERETITSDAGYEFLAVRSDSFDELTNNPGSQIKYVNLQSADGALVLQLIEYVSGGGASLELDHNRAGSLHFSFFVDDVDATWAKVNELDGVEAISAVVQIAPNMRSFYVADPDGVPIELLQIVR